MTKAPLVLVEWDDSVASGSWEGVADVCATRVATCVTVGYRTADTKQHVTICPTVQHSSRRIVSAIGSMTIPRVAIRRLTRLLNADRR